jgi:hypothetical protein
MIPEYAIHSSRYEREAPTAQRPGLGRTPGSRARSRIADRAHSAHPAASCLLPFRVSYRETPMFEAGGKPSPAEAVCGREKGQLTLHTRQNKQAGSASRSSRSSPSCCSRSAGMFSASRSWRLRHPLKELSANIDEFVNAVDELLKAHAVDELQKQADDVGLN